MANYSSNYMNPESTMPKTKPSRAHSWTVAKEQFGPSQSLRNQGGRFYKEEVMYLVPDP